MSEIVKARIDNWTELYNRRNYFLALEEIESLAQSNANNPIVIFCYSATLLNVSKYDKAMEILKALQKSLPEMLAKATGKDLENLQKIMSLTAEIISKLEKRDYIFPKTSPILWIKAGSLKKETNTIAPAIIRDEPSGDKSLFPDIKVENYGIKILDNSEPPHVETNIKVADLKTPEPKLPAPETKPLPDYFKPVVIPKPESPIKPVVIPQPALSKDPIFQPPDIISGAGNKDESALLNHPHPHRMKQVPPLEPSTPKSSSLPPPPPYRAKPISDNQSANYTEHGVPEKKSVRKNLPQNQPLDAQPGNILQENSEKSPELLKPGLEKYEFISAADRLRERLETSSKKSQESERKPIQNDNFNQPPIVPQGTPEQPKKWKSDIAERIAKSQKNNAADESEELEQFEEYKNETLFKRASEHEKEFDKQYSYTSGKDKEESTFDYHFKNQKALRGGESLKDILSFIHPMEIISFGFMLLSLLSGFWPMKIIAVFTAIAAIGIIKEERKRRETSRSGIFAIVILVISFISIFKF